MLTSRTAFCVSGSRPQGTPKIPGSERKDCAAQMGSTEFLLSEHSIAASHCLKMFRTCTGSAIPTQPLYGCSVLCLKSNLKIFVLHHFRLCPVFCGKFCYDPLLPAQFVFLTFDLEQHASRLPRVGGLQNGGCRTNMAVCERCAACAMEQPAASSVAAASNKPSIC